MAIGMVFHILGVIVWVGGIFFAHMVLRPSAGPIVPAIRLPLWHRVFARFFPWVWLSIAAILASGFALMFSAFGGFAAPPYIHAMMGLGIVMVLIFIYIYFVQWPRFRQAVPISDWPAAERAIGVIRPLVRVNLMLGVLTTVIGAGGRYFG